MALQPSKLVLYSRLLSSCTTRVRIAASFKNIPLEIVESGNMPADRKPYQDPMYLKMNPNATVPTLKAYYGNGESIVLTQSLSMLDFLEESYSGGVRLIPPVTDMAARCKVRDLALLVACDIQPLQSSRALADLRYVSKRVLALSKGDPRFANQLDTNIQVKKTWSMRLLARSMKVYEAMAKESAGKFSVGDEVSIADICLVAMVKSDYSHGVQFDEEVSYPTIERIVQTCDELDAFRTGVTPWSREVPTSL